MRSVPNTLFFKPMKEEPEEHHWSTMDSYKMNLKIMQTSKGPYLRVSHTIKENPMEDGVQWIRLPYLVGEKCYVRETWTIAPIKTTDWYRDGKCIMPGTEDRPHTRSKWNSAHNVIYRADGEYTSLSGEKWGWFSPATMPQWAARRFVTVLSCEPMRVSEVTEEDAIKLGFTFDEHNQVMARENFENDWHNRHPGKEWCWRIVSEPSGITG